MMTAHAIVTVAEMTVYGQSFGQIALRLGVSRSVVSGIVQRAKILAKDFSRNRRPAVDAVADWMAEFGGSVEACAAAIGSSERDVAKIWAAILLSLGWQAR